MILCVGQSLSYILYIHLLKNTTFAGFDGIDRLTYIVGDIVHCISLRGKRQHLSFRIGQHYLLLFLLFMRV